MYAFFLVLTIVSGFVTMILLIAYFNHQDCKKKFRWFGFSVDDIFLESFKSKTLKKITRAITLSRLLTIVGLLYVVFISPVEEEGRSEQDEYVEAQIVKSENDTLKSDSLKNNIQDFSPISGLQVDFGMMREDILKKYPKVNFVEEKIDKSLPDLVYYCEGNEFRYVFGKSILSLWCIRKFNPKDSVLRNEFVNYCNENYNEVTADYRWKYCKNNDTVIVYWDNKYEFFYKLKQECIIIDSL